MDARSGDLVGDSTATHSHRGLLARQGAPTRGDRLELWRLGDEAGRSALWIQAGSRIANLTPALGEPPLASLLRMPLEEIHQFLDAVTWDASEAPGPGRPLKPIDKQEVWAAGVTYERSRDARMEESEHSPDVYEKIYLSERPELFFKATPERVRGPGEQVVIRGDSTWDVPEPELAVFLNKDLEVVGYGIGNDVSSRALEGENPLYLPQAKIYQGSCALGPCIVPAWTIDLEAGLEISLLIERNGAALFTGTTNTRLIRKGIPTLVEYLGRENRFPDGVVLLTGTGIVPPSTVTLEEGDTIQIRIEGLGTLENAVRRGDRRFGPTPRGLQ